MKFILAFIALVIAVQAVSQKAPLQFNENGVFTMLQFTDLHYGEALDLDINTTRLMENLIDRENPDFLVFTGDMVAGYSWNKTEGWYKDMWKRWTTAINTKKVPYGYTLGNHDSEADLNRRQIVELDMTNPYSYTQMAEEGLTQASTYVIPVYSSKNPRKVIFNVWFFDSGDYNCLDVYGYGCVGPETVQWYREKSKELEKTQGGKKPGIAFMHIAPPDYMYIFNHYSGVGNKTEPTGCSSMNTGLIAAFKERGDMIGMFVGHDHKNDFVSDYEGLKIGYGRKTGYGCYGPAPGQQRGGRVFKFKEDDFKMWTYIINEDLTREYQVKSEPQIPPQDVCTRAKPPVTL